MISQYQKIQPQALMTSITRCLNTFPKPSLTHFYIFSTVYGQQGILQKAGVWPQLYLFPNQGEIMQNKLQTNSINKLPLQNTRENDKQTTCLVLRI